MTIRVKGPRKPYGEIRVFRKYPKSAEHRREDEEQVGEQPQPDGDEGDPVTRRQEGPLHRTDTP